MKKNKFYFVYLGYFFVFGILISIFVYLLNSFFVKDISYIFDKEVSFITKIKNDKMTTDIESSSNDLFVIKNNKIFINYLTDANSQNKDLLSQFFLALLESNEKFFQIRFLDKDGFEKIRVEKTYNLSSSHIVKDYLLQNKSDRYYFKDLIDLDKDAIYLSKLDLNIENGKIEFPIIPTLRVSTPIYFDDKFNGVLVININMKDAIKSLAISNLINFTIFNSNGEIIYDNKRDLFFPHLLHNTENYTNIKDIYNHSVKELLTKKITNIKVLPLFDDKYVLDEKLYLLVNANDLLINEIKSKQEEFSIYLALFILALSFPLASIISIPLGRLRAKLDETLDNLKSSMDIVDKYVLISKTNNDLEIVEVSSAFEKLTGYKVDEIIGNKHTLFKSGKTPDDIYVNLWNSLKNKESWTGEIMNIDKFGKYYWLKSTILPLLDENGNLSGYKSVSIDITDKKEIEKLSETDSLTKVYNRRKIDSIMEKEIYSSQRYSQSLSIIIADIDKFKLVNDIYGHQVGDQVLKYFSKLLVDNCRKSDIVGRWGGEEFIIILPHTEMKGAFELAENLRKTVEKSRFKDVDKLTASFGVSSYEIGDDYHTIVYKADMALYKSKENGRNRVTKE